MPSFDVLSPTRSMSADADHSDTDFEIDFSSSDDEAGVFFGTPKAVEHKIAAALSRSIPATPLTRERPSAPRRSSSRLQKRDSREFLRRKTLLLSTPGAGPSGDKMWEGGFHERTEELEDEPIAGPSTPMVPHEDIAVELDTLRLDTFPSSPEDDARSDDFFDEEEEGKENTAVPEEWDGEEGYDSEDEYVPAPPESVPMTIGFRDGQYDMGKMALLSALTSDLSPQLDMGGLSLLDIDDPEDVPLEFGNDTGGAWLRGSLGASTSSARSSDASIASIASASRACPLQPNTPSPIRQPRHFDAIVAEDPAQEEEEPSQDEEPEPKEEGADELVDCHDDRPVVEGDSRAEPPIAEVIEDGAVLIAVPPDASPPRIHATPDLAPSDDADNSMSSHDAFSDQGGVKSSPNASASSPFASLNMFSTFANTPPSAAKAPTFLDTTADLIAFTPLKPNGPTDAEVDPDMSYVSDMDSPKGRAPVMIPVFTVASPPNRSRPMRSLEPMLIDDLAPIDDDIDTAVALPTLDGPFGFGFSPFARAPAATVAPIKSPSKLPVLSPAQTAKVQKTLARRAAAKEQLESLFSSKLGKSGLGESTSKVVPRVERPLATSSRLPSKATIQSPEVSRSKQEPPAKPHFQSPEVSLKGKGKAPDKPLKSILKSTSKVTQPKPFALSGPRQKLPTKRPAPGQSALPRPAPAAASSFSRPVSKRLPTAGSTSAETAPGRLFRITPKPPVSRPADAVGSLKRPYAATQATAARAAVPAGTSAAPNSRPTLGMPSRPVRDSGTAFLSSSTNGSGLGGGLSRPPVKSPGKMLSPSKPVLGKPYRPTGITPMASRTIATPQRWLPTPSKAFKVSYKIQIAADTQLGTPSRPAATPLKLGARMAAVSEERRLSCTPIRGEEPPTPPRWVNQRMDVDEPVARTEPVAEPPVLEMPAHAEARVMASPPPSIADSLPVPVALGTASLSPEGGQRKECSPPSDDKEPTPPSRANSEPPNPPKPSVENASPSDSPPKQGEDAKQEAAQEPEADPPEARRSMRTRTPRPSQTLQDGSPNKSKAPPADSIVPGMTERALRTATTRNTARNQVYLCTIDRKIVRVQGERPPSPSPGTRTADREAEEQKAGRNARAKRRARASVGESETDEEADDEAPPVERAVLGRLAPGDDEEYKTPVRPAKRARIASSNSDDGQGNAKRVRWDEGLLIIRCGLGEVQNTRRSPPARSCVTPRARYQLDEQGNAVNRPTEKLKRTTITVNATFYDGEEPMAFNYNRSASGKRKGKK